MGFIDETDEENEDEITFKDRLIGKGRHNRTETIIESAEVFKVRKALREQGGEEVTDDFLVDIEDDKVSKVCFIPVKEGVRWWNVLAIPLVPCLTMLMTTYVNA